MAYTYKVYGTGDVDNAVNNYNRVASSAPTYADSSETRQARQQADNYANSYTDKINKGYTSKYKGTIDELCGQYGRLQQYIFTGGRTKGIRRVYGRACKQGSNT